MLPVCMARGYVYISDFTGCGGTQPVAKNTRLVKAQLIFLISCFKYFELLMFEFLQNRAGFLPKTAGI
jgi:hypothetical protein